MISVKNTFEDFRAVNVLVVPIGENSLFDKHYDLLSRCLYMEMIELNRPSDWRAQLSPLQFIRWNMGSILFDYHRYDRYLNGPGNLDNYRSFDRVLVVIGLINFPDLGSGVLRIEEDLLSYSKRFPYVIVRRLFVFNYSFENNSISTTSTLSSSQLLNQNNIVIFPPEMECEGGGTMIEVHLKENMGNIAVNVILSIEQQLVQCEEARMKVITKTPPSTTLTTSDDVEDTQSILLRKGPRRVLGRIRKWMGDLCLQCCSPGDAIEHYCAAMTECSRYNDTLWLAGAYEGYAASILLLLKLGVSPIDLLGSNLKVPVGSTPEAAAMKLAEERANDSLALLTKSSAYAVLEVECAMKIVRIIASIPGLDREQRVIEGIYRAGSVQGLSDNQQSEVMMESALVCKALGMTRKYAFLLYLAALQLSELEMDHAHATLVHGILRTSSRQYGIDYSTVRGRLPIDEDVNASPPPSYLIGRWPGASWASMRRVVLSQLAHTAKEAGDFPLAADYLAALLRLTAASETKRRRLAQLWSTNAIVISSPSQARGGGVLSASEKSFMAEQSGESSVPTSPTTLAMSLHRSKSDQFMSVKPANMGSGVLNLEDVVFKRPTQFLQSHMLMDTISNADTEEGGGGSVAGVATHHALTAMRDTLSSMGDGSLNKSKDGKRKINVPKTAPYLHGLEAVGGSSVSGVAPVGALIGAGLSVRKRSSVGNGATGSAGPFGVAGGVGQDWLSTATSALTAPPSVQEEQDQCLRALDSVCSLLRPCHPLLLSGVPTLLTLRPLLHVDGALPLRLPLLSPGKTDVSGDASKRKNALFYDPFAAREKRDRGEVVEVLWSCQQPALVLAVLRNPLSVPLQLNNVRVVLTGVNYIVRAVSVTIPPNAANYEVLLEVRPLEVGLLAIFGLCYQTNNGSNTATVSADGTGDALLPEVKEPWEYPRKAVAAKRKLKNGSKDEKMGDISATGSGMQTARITDITVTPHSASLRVTPSWQYPSVSNTLSSPHRLEIYLGESRILTLLLENASRYLVSDVRVLVTEDWSGGLHNLSSSFSNTIELCPFSLSCVRQSQDGLVGSKGTTTAGDTDLQIFRLSSDTYRASHSPASSLVPLIRLPMQSGDGRQLELEATGSLNLFEKLDNKDIVMSSLSVEAQVRIEVDSMVLDEESAAGDEGGSSVRFFRRQTVSFDTCLTPAVWIREVRFVSADSYSLGGQDSHMDRTGRQFRQDLRTLLGLNDAAVRVYSRTYIIVLRVENSTGWVAAVSSDSRNDISNRYLVPSKRDRFASFTVDGSGGSDISVTIAPKSGLDILLEGEADVSVRNDVPGQLLALPELFWSFSHPEGLRSGRVPRLTPLPSKPSYLLPGFKFDATLIDNSTATKYSSAPGLPSAHLVCQRFYTVRVAVALDSATSLQSHTQTESCDRLVEVALVVRAAHQPLYAETTHTSRVGSGLKGEHSFAVRGHMRRLFRINHDRHVSVDGTSDVAVVHEVKLSFLRSQLYHIHALVRSSIASAAGDSGGVWWLLPDPIAVQATAAHMEQMCG